MGSGALARRDQPQLTEHELADGFFRLAREEWRIADALPFLRRLKALPSLSAPFLVGYLLRGGPRERETATALLRLLAGPRVIVPMREVLGSPSASDEARVAAASVLEALGEKVNLQALSREVKDPQGLFQTIWDTVLDRAQGDPAFRERLLVSMQENPAPAAEEVIRSLAEPRDPRALTLLLPLLYSKRAGAILAAIDAIESLGGDGAIQGLREQAEGDPSPRVRRRARVAYGRLIMRCGPWLLPPPEDPRPAPPRRQPLPLHRSCVTLIDRQGHQAVLVSRRRPDGLLRVASILVSDTEGIKSCFGVDVMSEEELAGVEAGLRIHGLPPVELELEACRAVLAEARALNLQNRRRLPLQYEVWRELLDGPPTGHLHEASPADDDLDLSALLPMTGALLATPEFSHWLLDPRLVRPYVDRWSLAALDQRGGETGEAWEMLVDQAVCGLIDRELGSLLGRRLARQAWLLQRLGREESARLAAAAAWGLDPVRGVPPQAHPFVRGMVANSLFDAGRKLWQAGPATRGWAPPGQNPSRWPFWPLRAGSEFDRIGSA